MRNLIKKFGGAWYIETILMGSFLTGVGLLLVFVPFWSDELVKLGIGVKLAISSIGVLGVWLGVLELLSAKKRKNLEDAYVDPW